MADPICVLKGIDFCLGDGQAMGIYGASGSGKSTLLHILGGLDVPTSGDVFMQDRNIGNLRGEELSNFRNRSVGFVFQFYHLLPEFSALENVMLPALIAGHSRKKAKAMAEDAMGAVGLAGRAGHRPAMLSGGEQQRVAIARAVVQKPPLILADEPTGNLDRETGESIWNFLLHLNRDEGIAMVVVTHNRDLMKSLSAVFELRDGILRPVDTEGLH